MNIKIWKILPLIFGSGLCSLVYQLVWMRELRLVFGSSTMATSAVLAIFMGGIGFGSILLGKKAETCKNSLRLYGYFELVIAVSAMISPFLILSVQYLYLTTGGAHSMGFLPATILRLLLSTLALGVPSFFMGGTLPAIAKTATHEIDWGRRDLGFLYGMNTLGAVTGVYLVIFVMLESLGSRATIWSAGILNLLIAADSLYISRHGQDEIQKSAAKQSAENPPVDLSIHPTIVEYYIYFASCMAGLCFFFMELIWYRMLTPLLGGTTYTMGIILIVALSGLAVGSWGYGLRRYSVKTSLGILALTFSLEAFFIALPFALGDRIAILASLLRPIGAVGMGGYAVGWFCITMIVILPASIAAGYQFPLLIGLKGQGRPGIAKETGRIYAWNTLGAITGALIGGGFLIPLLGAVFSWQINVVLICSLVAASIILSMRHEGRQASLLVPAGFSLLAVLLLFSQGPTAVWRHTPIGSGRIDLSSFSRNEIRNWINKVNRHIIWVKEGREASLAIENIDGISFVINGKVDGNVEEDAGTQIMAPLIGAILHPNPKKALVVGLGTGSSTGWLAAVDGIDQVDTVEIEPGMLEVARRSSRVNRDALRNDKVNIIIGDARETLLASKNQYDIIFSEPSNPYRAGIASLYTQEFYQAVAKRLNPNGYFTQWVQGYEVDTQTIKVIYTTLASVFPVVETWETNLNDLIFVCSLEESDYSIARLREKIKIEPFKSALLNTGGIIDLEGLMAHFAASSSLARQVAAEAGDDSTINTDDNLLVEYGFARSLGMKQLFSIMDIRRQAKIRGENRPSLIGGEIDWEKVGIYSHTRFPMEGWQTPEVEIHDEQERFHAAAFNFYIQGNTSGTVDAWQRYGRQPEYPFELMIVAESLADLGHSYAQTYASQLQEYWPVAAEAVMARYYWRTGQRDLAYQSVANVLIGFRTNPWPQKQIIRHSLLLLEEMAAADQTLAPKLYQLITEHFSVYILESDRLKTLLGIAKNIDVRHVANAVEKFEPYPPWEQEFLEIRLKSYKMIGHSLAERAEDDLEEFLSTAPIRFTVGGEARN
ncbi:MAG: fused MFS/spermidine synthase [Desulfurivibrionaceae bacterium]